MINKQTIQSETDGHTQWGYGNQNMNLKLLLCKWHTEFSIFHVKLIILITNSSIALVLALKRNIYLIAQLPLCQHSIWMIRLQLRQVLRTH